MTIRKASIGLGVLLACAAWAQPAWAQQQTTTDDLQKQIEALKAQMKAVQKDLDEIKALLAPLRVQQPPPPENVALDLGTRPVKGEPSAKLTLVEFTDYQ